MSKKWELVGAVGNGFELWGQDMQVFAGCGHTVIDLDTENGQIGIDVTIKGPHAGFGFKF